MYDLGHWTSAPTATFARHSVPTRALTGAGTPAAPSRACVSCKSRRRPRSGGRRVVRDMGGDDRGGPRGPAGPWRRPGGPAPQQRPAAPPLPPSWPPGPTRPVRRGAAPPPPPRANPPRPTAVMPAAEPPRQRVPDRPPVQPPRRPPAVRAPRRRGGWGRKLRVLLLVLLLAVVGFGVWVD